MDKIRGVISNDSGLLNKKNHIEMYWGANSNSAALVQVFRYLDTTKQYVILYKKNSSTAYKYAL